MVMVNKRATFLGLMASLPTYYLIYKPLQLSKNKWATFVFLALYYFLFCIISLNIKYFGQLFLDLTNNRNIALDYFLTGRLILVDQLQPEVYNSGIMKYLFGHGPGQSEYYLWKTLAHPVYEKYEKPYLVHNDFLKLNFDIGLIGLVLYFLMIYYLYAVSNLGVLMFLYTVPLFLIDNTIIYLYNILVAAIVARIHCDPNEPKIETPITWFINKVLSFMNIEYKPNLK
jgi:hypothetical protein